MKKIIFLITVLFLASSVQAATLPSDLEFNVTFGYFKLSSDGSTWHDLVSSPVTINLLDPATKSSTGETVSMEVVPSGNYKYLKMSVTAMVFSQPGYTDRDIFPTMKAMAGSGDWSAMVEEIVPFTYSGGPIHFNMYMPDSNIAGSSFDKYFPMNGPIFSLSGGTKSETGAGKIHISIPSGIDAGNVVYAGAFMSPNKDVGPRHTAVLTNAGDGSASGIMKVVPGSWFVMAISSSTEPGPSGPTEGSKTYTEGGALPWSGSLVPVTAAADSTTEVTLAFAFTMTSSMGAGGSMQPPIGDSSMLFAVEVPGGVTLRETTELMLYAFSTEAGAQGRGAPDYFLDSISIPAGYYTGGTIEADNLGAGHYFVNGFLNVSKTTPPVRDVDYGGGYCGGPGPQIMITLEANQHLDLSSQPIRLEPISDH